MPFRKKPALTSERLREVLSYDEATGIFVWRESRGKAKAGSRAGKMRDTGRCIGIDGEYYQAARLAWFWIHGEWPERLLRFRDDNRDNVAISNLWSGEFDFTTQAGKNAYAKKWRKANPRGQRHIWLKSRFGITLADYQTMLVAQEGKCAICRCSEIDAKTGEVTWLPVDHDHGDGSVRGLLCSRCNHMLGHAKDNPETLRRAAAYLESHASKPETNVIPLIGRKTAGEK